MMYTEINGLRIRYDIQGEGEAILILHGWGCKIEVYRRLTEDLSRMGKVYILDLPGFGESSEPKEPWDAAAYADFVQQFILQMGLDSLTLIGHSNGGRIILKMMGRKNLPFSVRKIILIDSAGVVAKKSFSKRLRQRMYKIGRAVLSTKPFMALFPDALENLRQKHGSADYKAASPIMRQTLVLLVNEDMTGYCPGIRVPVLLIWGENDTATPLSHGQLLEKLIPGSGLVVLQNAGHYSFLDQPYSMERILRSFLNS